MSPAPGFAAWLAGFRARHGDPARALPEGLAPIPEVAARAANQAEFTLSAAAYMARALPKTRISDGRAAHRHHRGLLETLARQTGVAAEIITAIWGIETDYGRRRGSLPVIATLATLAHASPRAAYFAKELLAALQLASSGTAPEDWRGSWSGASGHCQFMPSAVAQYAIDHDADGRANIWADDPTDALASIANYLAAHGWQSGAGWLDQTRPDRPETLLIPAGLPGPAFTPHGNFQVLLSYNRATLYALAVGLLAHAIAGRAAPPTFPDRPPLTRAEVARLQRALSAQGFDTQGHDGLIGPNTTAAIRAWQKANGQAPDGFASKDLLLHLG